MYSVRVLVPKHLMQSNYYNIVIFQLELYHVNVYQIDSYVSMGEVPNDM